MASGIVWGTGDIALVLTIAAFVMVLSRIVLEAIT